MTTVTRQLGSAAILALALVAAPAQAAWVASWAASPQAGHPGAGAFPASPSFNNRTVRQVVRLSAGGNRLRVRFTNAFGAGALTIGAARIVLLDQQGKEIPGTSRKLTFSRGAGAVIPKGAPLLSDAVDLQVPALAQLAISTYLPTETGLCTCHDNAMAESEVSAPGDFTAQSFKAESTFANRAFLSTVEVDGPATAGTIAIIGDSITDGVGSTRGANRRWPDFLAERLTKRGGRTWGVANQGISGNRILNDGAGESALARFDRDIASMPGLKIVLVFEGINDIGFTFGKFDGPMGKAMEAMRGRPVGAAEMIVGLRQIAERAHAAGAKAYVATIAPYKGASYWTQEGEAVRQEVNHFIRTSGTFDAVIDFDKALGDPADPLQVREGFHAGDHLHGSDAGYRAMAEAIDLRLFPR